MLQAEKLAKVALAGLINVHERQRAGMEIN